MKKLISILLVAVLAMGIMAPMTFAAGYEKLPIIYIRGNGEPLYYEDGTKLVASFDDISFGDSSEEGEDADVTKDKIVDAAVNILKPFVLEGMIFDNWDNYGKAVYEELVPLFGEDAGLDENGNAKKVPVSIRQSLQIQKQIQIVLGYIIPIRSMNSVSTGDFLLMTM